MAFQTGNRYLNNPFGSSDARFEYQKEKFEVQGKDDLIVVDQEVADRRLAFQKTAELHKKLNDIRPNAIFQSQVKRATTIDDNSSAQLLGDSNFLSTGTTTFANVNSNTENLALAPTGEKVRTGQDAGYFVHRAELLNPSFNSTAPRFNYKAKDGKSLEAPGPGSYNCPTRQSDLQRSPPLNDQSSIFKDVTPKMDDPKGMHGTMRHQNRTGPGEYEHDTHFVDRSFNKSLPPAKFV